MDKKIVDLDKELKKKIDNDIERANELITEQTKKLMEMKNQMRTLEDRNRRNNLRVDGIDENEGETWDQTEAKIQRLLKDKLYFNDTINIERAHRMGKKNGRRDNNDRPRTIIIKLLNYKDKVKILKNAKKLKDTGIYINEDFSVETNEIRKNLKPQMNKARLEGKHAVIVYDRLITSAYKQKIDNQ